MGNDTIIVKRNIEHFKVVSKDPSKASILHTVGGIVTFPLNGNHSIEVERQIIFYFQFDKSNTKIVRLSKADFEYMHISDSVLEEIAEKFNLMKRIGSNSNYFSLHIKNLQDFETCMLAFREIENSIYMIVFSSKKENEARSPSEDFYGSNIYYIHSITHVEL